LKGILIPLAAAGWLASFSILAASPSPINPARMSAMVKTPASNAFEGRAPGTAGEAKTVAYLIHRFRALGLEPAGENGGWTQQVPSVHNTSGNPSRLEVSVGGSILPLVAGRDINPQTVRPLPQVTIAIFCMHLRHL
jgi:hypothetical protein